MQHMIGSIIGFEELRRLCRPNGPKPRLQTVCSWADKQGIRYKWDNAGGIWTTMEAVNAALDPRKENNVTVKEELI